MKDAIDDMRQQPERFLRRAQEIIKRAERAAPVVGQVVTLERWDKTERPENRYGRCRVLAINDLTIIRCESGLMVLVEMIEFPHKKIRLDWHWMKPA